MTKPPTKAQRQRWNKLSALGCAVAGCLIWVTEIHHCFTGGGGRKDHDKTIALCFMHHRGTEGIHTIGRKTWREKYGEEQDLLDEQNRRLENE